jgi:hypothetical protein
MAIGPDSVQIRNLDKQAARLRRLSEIINSTYAPCVSVSEVFPARLNQPGGWRGGWAGAAGARTAADWVVPGYGLTFCCSGDSFSGRSEFAP